MRRVLLTGMSGTGKSTVVQQLVALGCKAIDLDDGWCEPQPDGRQLWREDALTELLSVEDTDLLFVAGCEANMAMFLPRFDVVILLTVPLDVALDRLANRTANPYGKSAADCERVRDDFREVEPRLRRIADHEVQTTDPVDDIVATVLRLAMADSA